MEYGVVNGGIGIGEAVVRARSRVAAVDSSGGAADGFGRRRRPGFRRRGFAGGGDGTMTGGCVTGLGMTIAGGLLGA